MKKLPFILPVIVWIFLFFIEIISLFFQYPKPMYFRAWEAVINEGLDGYYVPFKPLSMYSGIMEGDLLKLANFLPRIKDIRHQVFITDEYGFRNRRGMLDKKIDAVILGTSFVGGAQETQKNLISELLTDRYSIPTYNYATQSIQHFWEDNRFIKTPPRYLIIVGNEAEILQNNWIETLQDTNIQNKINKWNSKKDWNDAENSFIFSYANIANYTKRFSIIRYLLDYLALKILNNVFPRAIIAYTATNNVVYEQESDFIFIDLKSYDPTLTQTKKAWVEQTINTLNQTNEILKKRNITLIIAVMPSKASLYSKLYKYLPRDKKTLPLLEEKLDKTRISHINLYDAMYNLAIIKNKRLYYNDDGHWTSEVNFLISKLISQKIGEFEQFRQ